MSIIRKGLKKAIICCVVVLSCTGFLNAKVINVTHKEEKQWLRYLLPLPHEISIEKKIVVILI